MSQNQLDQSLINNKKQTKEENGGEDLVRI